MKFTTQIQLPLIDIKKADIDKPEEFFTRQACLKFITDVPMEILKEILIIETSIVNDPVGYEKLQIIVSNKIKSKAL